MEERSNVAHVCWVRLGLGVGGRGTTVKEERNAFKSPAHHRVCMLTDDLQSARTA